MAEPDDMILPLLREMRAEIAVRFSKVDSRLDSVDERVAKLAATLEHSARRWEQTHS